MSRCTGHCCERFCINLDVLTHPANTVIDGDFIRDMVIPLEPAEGGEGAGHWYATCRHFDGTNCRVYEERPALCRDYPYGAACKFQGCTMSAECSG